MIIGEDKIVKVELKESEIQEIIEVLQREQWDSYTFLDYDKIIQKLKSPELEIK